MGVTGRTLSLYHGSPTTSYHPTVRAMPYTETDSLLDGSWELPPSEPVASSASWPSKKRLVALVASVAAVSAVGLASSRGGKNQVAGAPILAASEQGLHFSVRNAYGETKYGREHPFIGDKFVVEPHKLVTFLPVLGKASSSRATSFRWEIEGANGAEIAVIAFGQEAEVSFTEPGEVYAVKVVAHDAQGNELERFESQVVSAYVKRELRNMNEHDRETFLDAAAVLWRTPTAEGRALYGAQYTGMDTFVQGTRFLIYFVTRALVCIARSSSLTCRPLAIVAF